MDTTAQVYQSGELHTKSLCARCSGCLSAYKWFPERRIEEWRDYIARAVYGAPITHDKNSNQYAIISNIAYNLQNLDYLNQNIKEQFLSRVLLAQTFKTFAITATQVVEGLLYLKIMNSPYALPPYEKISLTGMIELAWQKKLVITDKDMYINMNRLKKRRNKIHLHAALDISDADYAMFGRLGYLNDTKIIVRRFLQRFFEIDEATRREIFSFLEDTPDTNHTVDKYDHDYQDTFPSGVKIFKEDV